MASVYFPRSLLSRGIINNIVSMNVWWNAVKFCENGGLLYSKQWKHVYSYIIYIGIFMTVNSTHLTVRASKTKE